MAYENLTTFTEVDPNNKWSQTVTRNTATLVNGDNSYVYKDYEIGHFGDYEHWLDIRLINATAPGAVFGFWTVADSPGEWNQLWGSGKGQGIVSTNSILRLAGYSAGGFDDSNFSLTLNITYYLKVYRIGSTTTCKIYPTANDRINDTNVIDTLIITNCNTDTYRYLQCGHSHNNGWALNNSGYTENLDLNEPLPPFEGEDTLTLSDELEINVSLEKIELSDTLTLSDDLKFDAEEQESEDTTSLSDEIEFLISKEEDDILTLSDTIDVITQFDLKDTLSLADEIDIREIELVLNDIYNKFNMLKGTLEDVNNKINTQALSLSDIKNDVRFLQSWQVAGDAGYQSLGKTYVKLYIDDEEQTDVDINSISISKVLNSSHSASFLLGRPYDNTKPTQESVVKIKYHIWTLYKGYITQITPTAQPDSIKIICQDKYWKENKTKQYFHIGHKPADDKELYYNYISQGLSACGVNFGIGAFIPQPMNCFGQGTSDCITNLVTNAGNYAWYYDVEDIEKLWTGGQGDIINLERQEIGKNLGLYQVLRHSFRESIERIVNKFRVQMGEMVIRQFNTTGGSKEYTGYRYYTSVDIPSGAWNSYYERLSQDSPDGYGVFSHPVDQNDLYKDVFIKYSLMGLDLETESWTDRFPPTVQVLIPASDWKCSLGVPYGLLTTGAILTEGFSIDYEEGTLTFNEPLYLYQTDASGAMTAIRRPYIILRIGKKQYYSETTSPYGDPTTDISNPLMFFTDKMGDYVETIMENLNLSGLGIQIGGWYLTSITEDAEGRTWKTYRYVPSWDDTLFAKDMANWQLSANCDKKISGTIEVTIDNICFYGIDLSKRIMIENVIENPLNIKAITLNISNWSASIQLENDRYYKRSASIPSHGE